MARLHEHVTLALTVYVIISSTIVHPVQATTQCTDINLLTNVQHGKRLTGHTFIVLQIIKGVQQCAQACRNRKRCKSFNLKTDVVYGNCELNLNTSSETGSITEEAGYIYSDISHWPQSVGACSNHQCSYDQHCVSSMSPLCQNCSRATICGACSPIREVQNRTFQSYGCYSSIPRVLPDNIGNFRGNIVWSNLEATIYQCANAAATSGHGFFGIEFYGECYGGNASQANFASPVDIAQCATECSFEVGSESHMYVYQWI